MHDPPSPPRSRDTLPYHYDLSYAVHGTFPSRDTASPITRSRANNTTSHRRPTSARSTPTMSATSSLRPSPTRSAFHANYPPDIHQSTCLNMTSASSSTSDSDLWILPDIEIDSAISDWPPTALHTSPSPSHSPDESTQPQNQSPHDWALYLRRAARSNLERLRARLEGDGWEFVGGKYGDDERGQIRGSGGERAGLGMGEERVDEEFDVVVLNGVR